MCRSARQSAGEKSPPHSDLDSAMATTDSRLQILHSQLPTANWRLWPADDLLSSWVCAHKFTCADSLPRTSRKRKERKGREAIAQLRFLCQLNTILGSRRTKEREEEGKQSVAASKKQKEADTERETGGEEAGGWHCHMQRSCR